MWHSVVIRSRALRNRIIFFTMSIIFYYCQFGQDLLDLLKYKIKPPSFALGLSHSLTVLTNPPVSV